MAAALEIEPTDVRLLAEPLDYLEAEHYRQRVFLSHVERLISETVTRGRARIAGPAADFLRRDLSRHFADEEDVLFPLLRRRCSESLLNERRVPDIEMEHARARSLCPEIAAGIEQVAADAPTDARQMKAIVAFVRAFRRLLSLENEYVLPLARQSLHPTDHAAMSKTFAMRRGLRKRRRIRQSGYFGD